MDNSNIIKNQKKLAYEVLEYIQVYDEKAILAGGACRNWVHKKPANDLDFYVKLKNEDTIEKLVNFLDVKFKKINRLVDDKLKCYTQSHPTPIDFSDISPLLETDYKKNNMTDDILDVYQIEYKGMVLQFIILKSNVENYINHFTNSLCEVTWDSKNFYMSKSFVDSMKNKKMVIKLPKHIFKHINKMVNYYPDYKITFEELK